MKYYFLLETNNDGDTEVLLSCKDYRNKFTLVLKYVDEKKIKSINDEHEFAPWEVKDGLHLVKIKDDVWEVHEVVNTGIIRDYWVNCCVGKIFIQEFDVKDTVDDADALTNALKELAVKIRKK